MNLFDSHSHYNDSKFDIDREEIIKETLSSGVSNFIVAGYGVESSKKAIEIANEYEGLYAIVGISPNDLENINTEEDIKGSISKIEELASNSKVVAIGEIGLDYYWTKENKDKQIYFFEKQLDLAEKYDLPVIVHARDSVQDVFDILKKHKVRGTMHCYSGSLEMAKEFVKIGFYIGIDGPITFKNNKKGIEVVKEIPIDRLLLETDSPYLSPEPNRGKQNSPLNLIFIAEKISEIKGITVEEVVNITTKNAKELFNL